MEVFMRIAGVFVIGMIVAAFICSYDVMAGDGDEVLWLGLDFENQLAPNAGSFKDSVKSNFSRKGVAYTPDGCEVSADTPRFVEGHKGQGLYIGGVVRNLLKPALAEIAFPEGKVQGIESLRKCKVAQIESDDAFVGDNSLSISTSKRLNSGIKIPLTVSGNGLYIFSFYLKGNGFITLSAKFAEEDDANLAEKPLKINATSEWKRHFIWFYAKDSAEVAVELKSAMGKRMKFEIDALQLEKQKKVNANFEKKQFPYGTGFSPGPWINGRKKSMGDVFRLTWSPEKAGSFPFEEGTITVWIKPEFNPEDCRHHQIFSRYYMWYSLAKRCYSQVGFMRGANEAENKSKNPNGWLILACAKVPALKRGVWSRLTVVWSNKREKIAIYSNGKLLKEDRSLTLTDYKSAQRNFLIGSHAKDGFLNGTLDELSIYSKAFTPEEVKASFEKESK
jgi:hypothetical protein